MLTRLPPRQMPACYGFLPELTQVQPAQTAPEFPTSRGGFPPRGPGVIVALPI